MELTQLRYFLQVYHVQNICTASAQLNVTQQAVSKQIQHLEDEIGVTLFERNSRGVRPTVYADLLAQKLQRFLPELDAFVYDLQSRDRETAGVVRLGVQCWQMGITHGLCYSALHSFEQAYPRVHLLWENAIPLRCQSGLYSRELDLAVMSMPDDPSGFVLTPLRPVRWYMLMSRCHPLAGRSSLSDNDLAGQKLILSENESESRNRICQNLIGQESPVFIDVKDFVFDLISQQIEGENALMLTTETVLHMFNPERFVMVPFQSADRSSYLYLARLSGIALTPAAQALYHHLLEHWCEDSQPQVVACPK